MSLVLSELVVELKALAPFAAVPEDQLQWLIDQAEIRSFSPGDRIFEPGIVSEYMSVVIKGRFRVYVTTDGKQREIARIEQGEITGVLPYSRIRSAIAVGEAIEESIVMMTHRDVFKTMIPMHYELTEALVHVMSDRIRNFTTLQQQNEKLMSLGKLSAGLAHELNNPAAALVSTSEELRKQLQYRPEKFKRVIAIKMDDDVIDLVNNILWAKANAGPNDNLSLMEKTEREDDLRDWLEDEDLEVDDDMIDNFVDYGFTPEELTEINEAVPGAEIGPVLNWMEQVLSTNRMIGEIKEASSRISELVGSIKDYTHMDRDQDRQLIDVHEGIINTVIMLKHKVKKNNIALDKSFGKDLPKIYAFPGELNQVWTNLIDNALDAMDEKGGTLSIHTSMDGPCLKVCISDTGKGIPEDVLPRIFDPFFTTKAQGKGTGLGLDVVRKIVEHHKADISVTSQPGKTEFVLLFSVE